MAVAFDASGNAAGGAGTFSWTHTPVGTPKGVWVFVGQDTGITDEVTGVTYGGVAMARPTAGSPTIPITRDGVQDGAVYVYFLGSSIPTGAQTVEVTVNGTGSLKRAYSGSVTASADTEVVDCNSASGSSLTPSLGTLSLGGRTCQCAIGWWSQQGSAANVSPNTGWTSRNENATGSGTIGHYTYDTVDTTDVAAGFTHSTPTGFAGIALAISEVAGGSVTMADLPAVSMTIGVGSGFQTVVDNPSTDAPTSGYFRRRILRQYRAYKNKGGGRA